MWLPTEYPIVKITRNGLSSFSVYSWNNTQVVPLIYTSFLIVLTQGPCSLLKGATSAHLEGVHWGKNQTKTTKPHNHSKTCPKNWKLCLGQQSRQRWLYPFVLSQLSLVFTGHWFSSEQSKVCWKPVESNYLWASSFLFNFGLYWLVNLEVIFGDRGRSSLTLCTGFIAIETKLKTLRTENVCFMELLMLCI